MLDSPILGHDPGYQEQALDPLAKGEGVACFLARDADQRPAVLYFTHVLSGAAGRFALDANRRVRAAQAIAVQQAARARARAEGFEPLIA